ncbi:phosphoenolpyruvate carboxykinase (GTP) [Cellulomonas denverensis]|uniref:Phosphoenolpyruvate carboxykinase [GTP] n=1 Tax=Cellulomonas denverensis TaxID=264297 RepID=A0A7X6KUB0_9CELL|nr:phosphoenolpyruvate carboxykinase (GTP) [Cellulomonas denverensis]NKY22278.1 phosphoenolpyruvate carboxykinase (GTP) [Cellulomonas denverensis]GIG25893.1 phosphoenolpyruvate carboxykinase [GTP] [Cellulomonas denverensis]
MTPTSPLPPVPVTDVFGGPAPTLRHPGLAAWVEEMTALTQPDAVVWCEGSSAEYHRLCDQLVDQGTFIRLSRPNSFLARSTPDDVARVEGRTFVCPEREEDAGPSNNWREPAAMRAELDDRFRGAMTGRTLYVVPFAMGPIGSPLTQIGVEITDSPYVVVSMHLMARVGREALDSLGTDGEFVRAMHSVGRPLIAPDGSCRPDVPWPSHPDKYIVHFPQDREIWSFGSGYGGNALLGKKCFALRIASAMGRDEGWLAEHMLLLRMTTPDGHDLHLAGAFPSACGKTNLAMIRPTLPGWTIRTLGDDIVWMRPGGPGTDGRLRAINPEAGFFGVAPGTGPDSNPVAVEMIARDTIFTNVALTDDGDVWWEGLTDQPPAHLIDWRGQEWTPDCDRPAAHPNSRFTVSVQRCPTLDSAWDDPAGVPVDIVLFGGRRATTVPLVAEAPTWERAVFAGATMASERTAAAEGTLGQVRRDPFAMLPFSGYHLADHWTHWLALGARLGPRRPRVFQVNWFRRGAAGRFLWPGFGENSRVLAWIADRVLDRAEAVETPVGLVPAPGALDITGLDLPPGTLDRLLDVDLEAWQQEVAAVREFFAGLGDRVPPELTRELDALERRLAAR